MTGKDDISVLIATFNGSKYLNDQIDSVFNQRGLNTKLYISDDNSTDNTLDLIRSYKNKISLLKCDQKRKGPGLNFYNLILNVPVETEYYALCDQDDIWLNGKLIEAISVLKKNKADGYSCSFIPFDNSGIINSFSLNTKQKNYDFYFQTPGPGCTFVITKKLLLDFRDFLIYKKNYTKFEWHDWLLYAFARFNKYKWYIDDRKFLKYRQHTENYVGYNNGVKAKLLRIKRILNNDWITEVRNLYFMLNDMTLNKKNLNKFNLFLVHLIIKPFQLRRSSIESLIILLVITYYFVRNKLKI